ncbi:MAG TPA: antibiotic biosynthesis monooxygenase, partial [Terriglobia bacterium]|nr:antibiotic biosynthesis monooxygenase [Terriglobia bacterium]
MILEVAILDIKAGQSKQFESAFEKARVIIASAAGCLRHEIHRSADRVDHYVLFVWWDSIESHTVGFRGSAEYHEWKRLLHHFYDPFPHVEHFFPADALGRTKRLWIMISGPYRSGSNDPLVWAENLARLNEAAVTVFKKGHVPVIGVNMALPVIEQAGVDSYD